MAGDPAKPFPPKAPAVFNCPNCGAGVEVRALGLSISVVCKACGSIIDANDENHKILSRFQVNESIQPLIPLGQRGKLGRTRWEAVGFMVRSDASGQFQWREYLLFNPTQGFRWLTEFNGHWNFVTTIKKNAYVARSKKSSGRRYADYMNRKYYLFNKGPAHVRYVLGEFYWRVKVGDIAETEDYVCPPEMLSHEKAEGEVIWSVGEYMDAEAVKAAFNIKKSMPVLQGVGPNQPSSLDQKTAGMGGLWMKFSLVMAAIQLLTLFLSKNETVFSHEYIFSANANEVTPPFELKYGRANVEVELYSPVMNNWLEIGVELVNEHTGNAYGFEQGVEFYSGSDSDGSWTEGSPTGKYLLSRIPAGIYHLNIKPSMGAINKAPNQPYKVVVARDVTIWANFAAALSLWSFVPALIFLRKTVFEANRWSTSDFSPYESGN